LKFAHDPLNFTLLLGLLLLHIGSRRLSVIHITLHFFELP
jgi:hypothetical protein